jgi:hypothetical protein
MCEVTAGTNCVLHLLEQYKDFRTWNHLVGGSCRTNVKADAPSVPYCSRAYPVTFTLRTQSWFAYCGARAEERTLPTLHCPDINSRLRTATMTANLWCFPEGAINCISFVMSVRSQGTATRFPVQRFREILIGKIITGTLLDDLLYL